MAHREINLSDTTSFEHDPDGTGVEPYRETFEVVNPIFKRGREWQPGEQIDLDPATAARFIETGDMKETDQ